MGWIETVAVAGAFWLCMVGGVALLEAWPGRCPQCRRRATARVKEWDSGYGMHELRRCRVCGHEHETFVKHLRA